MTSRASASACAAPPMSFFIAAMLPPGFRFSPPVSKVMPLPIRVSFGCAGSPQRRSISRGGREAARPTAWMAGKLSSSSASPLVMVTLAPNGLGHLAHRIGKLGRPHVGGGRVDQVADQRGGFGKAHGFGDGGGFGAEQHARAGVALGLLVAGEAVLGEQPAQARPGRWRRPCGSARRAASPRPGRLHGVSSAATPATADHPPAHRPARSASVRRRLEALRRHQRPGALALGRAASPRTRRR